jgi:uncharacterized protein YukE
VQSLKVSTERLGGASASVSNISDQITGSAGFLTLAGDAGAGTPAAGAYAAAAQQWSSALPGYGGAVSDLASALAAAAQCYAQADRLPVAE